MELDFAPGAPYNAAFFGLYERVFSLYAEQHGTDAALAFMRVLFARALGAAYDETGFAHGNANDFARCVGERDASVGLHVRFPVIERDRIVYQFLTNLFPGLRGAVDAHDLDATYMDFKVVHVLGPDWTWRTTKHLWRGDDCTEHVIEKQ